MLPKIFLAASTSFATLEGKAGTTGLGSSLEALLDLPKPNKPPPCFLPLEDEGAGKVAAAEVKGEEFNEPGAEEEAERP